VFFLTGEFIGCVYVFQIILILALKCHMSLQTKYITRSYVDRRFQPASPSTVRPPHLLISRSYIYAWGAATNPSF